MPPDRTVAAPLPCPAAASQQAKAVARSEDLAPPAGTASRLGIVPVPVSVPRTARSRPSSLQRLTRKSVGLVGGSMAAPQVHASGSGGDAGGGGDEGSSRGAGGDRRTVSRAWGRAGSGTGAGSSGGRASGGAPERGSGSRAGGYGCGAGCGGAGGGAEAVAARIAPDVGMVGNEGGSTAPVDFRRGRKYAERDQVALADASAPTTSLLKTCIQIGRLAGRHLESLLRPEAPLTPARRSQLMAAASGPAAAGAFMGLRAAAPAPRGRKAASKAAPLIKTRQVKKGCIKERKAPGRKAPGFRKIYRKAPGFWKTYQRPPEYLARQRATRLAKKQAQPSGVRHEEGSIIKDQEMAARARLEPSAPLDGLASCVPAASRRTRLQMTQCHRI